MSEQSRPVDWAVNGLAQLFDTVLTVAGSSGDLAESDREQFVETGAGAFSAGMSLSGLIDSYLGGAGEVWEQIFADADPARTVELSRSLRRVSEHALSSLAEGFEAAQRLSIRAEESLRRTFLDDLLDRDPDPARLADFARKLDFPTFDQVIVAVAGADRNFSDGGPIHLRVKSDIESRAPTRRLVVTAKEGRIVIIAVDTAAADLCALVSAAAATLPEIEWEVGVGNGAATLEAIGSSYRQALDAMRIGRIFALDPPTEFARILPQRLFGADLDVTRALVATVMDPLTEKPRSELMATLASFIDHGGNMAEVARDLHIGSRTVAYRLGRISDLTGYSAAIPEERFVLELAYRAMPLIAAKQPRRQP